MKTTSYVTKLSKSVAARYGMQFWKVLKDASLIDEDRELGTAKGSESPKFPAGGFAAPGLKHTNTSTGTSVAHTRGQT